MCMRGCLCLCVSESMYLCPRPSWKACSHSLVCKHKTVHAHPNQYWSHGTDLTASPPPPVPTHKYCSIPFLSCMHMHIHTKVLQISWSEIKDVMQHYIGEFKWRQVEGERSVKASGWIQTQDASAEILTSVQQCASCEEIIRNPSDVRLYECSKSGSPNFFKGAKLS